MPKNQMKDVPEKRSKKVELVCDEALAMALIIPVIRNRIRNFANAFGIALATDPLGSQAADNRLHAMDLASTLATAIGVSPLTIRVFSSAIGKAPKGYDDHFALDVRIVHMGKKLKPTATQKIVLLIPSKGNKLLDALWEISNKDIVDFCDQRSVAQKFITGKL